MTPCTVQTMNSCASEATAASMICEVEPTTSASLSTQSPHSGWASTRAPGCSRRAASTSASSMASCVGQNPSFRMTFFSGTCSAT